MLLYFGTEVIQRVRERRSTTETAGGSRCCLDHLDQTASPTDDGAAYVGVRVGFHLHYLPLAE